MSDDEAAKMAQTVRLYDGFQAIIKQEQEQFGNIRTDAVLPALDTICQRLFKTLSEHSGKPTAKKVLNEFLKNMKSHIEMEI